MSHIAALEAEAIAGLVFSGVVTGIFFIRFLYNVYIDSDKCTQCVKLVRCSKKLLLYAAVGSFSILISYIAMWFEQGFEMRSDGVLVFWPRYVAYIVATGSLFQIVGHLVWMSSLSRNIASVLAMAFWLVVGIFGTLSPININWVYFGISFVPLVAALALLYSEDNRDDRIAKGKIGWVTFGLVAFAVVWLLAPEGLNEINHEEAHLGFIILEGLVFYLTYFASIFFYIPYGRAEVKEKRRGKFVPLGLVDKCNYCTNEE